MKYFDNDKDTSTQSPIEVPILIFTTINTNYVVQEGV